jgi:alkanesulfonate monooxygenase SsuD/methylene tetrahydromethanopterin reductase-like flavin-dependent oxidoreductase (luciferase family)
LQRIQYNSGRIVSGTPDEVRYQLESLATELGVEEVMITTMTHSHKDRIRSFELIADVFNLVANYEN